MWILVLVRCWKAPNVTCTQLKKKKKLFKRDILKAKPKTLGQESMRPMASLQKQEEEEVVMASERMWIVCKKC